MAFLVALVAAAPVQAQTSYAKEFWPEIDLHHWFGPNTQLITLADHSTNRESNQAYQGEVGAVLEHKFVDWFAARVGYRHGQSLNGGSYREDRLLTEQTFYVYLPAQVKVGFRTREDFRWLDTGFSVRLRERIQVERDFTIGSYIFTPYASAETYFDTRYDQFSRFRLILGSTFPVAKRIAVEPYLAHQVDTTPSVKIVDAIGLILHLTF